MQLLLPDLYQILVATQGEADREIPGHAMPLDYEDPGMFCWCTAMARDRPVGQLEPSPVPLSPENPMAIIKITIQTTHHHSA